MRLSRLEMVGKLQRKEILVAGLNTPSQNLTQMGFRTFTSPRTMLAELRKGVMLKWMHQHHEMELSDGDVTYGFVGTPEW